MFCVDRGSSGGIIAAIIVVIVVTIILIVVGLVICKRRKQKQEIELPSELVVWFLDLKILKWNLFTSFVMVFKMKRNLFSLI